MESQINNKSRIKRNEHLYKMNTINKTSNNTSIKRNTTINQNKRKELSNHVTNSNKNVNYKPIQKKKKKNKTKYYILLLIIILIISIITINKGKNEKNNNNTNEIKNVPEKELTEKEKKLKELDNINKRISFFKEENIDRYLNYKEKNEDLDLEKVIVYVNIGLDKKFYENINDSPNKNTNYILVNKYNFLGEDYTPDLEKINEDFTSESKYMTKDAAKAFEEMAMAAKKEGYNIRAVSTYRSYKYQTQLYNKYKAQDGEEKADTYSARPGYSEHQTGLAVDVDNKKVTYTNFGTTKEFQWMKKNAYKYGFILRYTKEYEPITGYMNEPWHYRYVGKDISEYIQNHPMTYEEYYVRFLDKEK